jgi:cytochrome b6-f complex iron-sulfur subunit
MDQNNPRSDQAPAPDGRRSFCKACIAGLTVASAGMVGYPVLSFMARPQTLDLNKPIEIGLDRLSPGLAQYVEYRGLQLIVLGTQGDPLVLDAACPHLGCNVTWDSGDSVFRCPCHGAVFTSEGVVVRGPVNAPLRKIPFEIRDGKVIISFEV